LERRAHFRQFSITFWQYAANKASRVAVSRKKKRKNLTEPMRTLFPLVFSTVFASLSVLSPAFAIDASVMRQLNKLAPEERLEQRCDIEAMERIATEQKDMRPDKVIAYTFGDQELDKGAGRRVQEFWGMVQAEIQVPAQVGFSQHPVFRLPCR